MNAQNQAFIAGGDLLSPDEAARFLGLSTGTLANLRCRGDGPAFHKVARFVRYDPRDLSNWVHARRYRSTAEAR